MPFIYFDPNDKIVNFDIHGPREGLYTIGPLARRGGKFRINNFGWNNDIDYSKEKPGRKLLAIIGDSYIEALQVDTDKNIAARLRGKLKDKSEVYSFGTAGAAMSQYLQISRYVNKYFRPDIMVINIVHNDFLESLCPFMNVEGYLCMQEINGKISEAPIKAFTPLLERPELFNKMKVFLIIHSSLFRYALINCHLYDTFKNMKANLFGRNGSYNANIDVEFQITQREGIKNATDYILNQFKKENQDKYIVFMIDGPRRDIYLGKFDKSNASWLNQILKESCSKYALGFLDLSLTFYQKYKSNNRKFNEEDDYHWNEYGHQVAADALYQYIQNNKLIE